MKMKNTNRDSLDFGKMDIPQLFVKLFVPTLIGMIFMAMFNVIDGIFVGKGVSSDALAAVNIAAPVFLFSTAASLMFASGVSIVAATHLAQGNTKAANINATQSIIVPLVFMIALACVIFFFPEQLNYLFGGSDRLLPYVRDYLRGIYLFPVLGVFLMVGSFLIRLDGSPNMAMSVNIVSALLNIFLDWLFIFPLKLGVWGAAVATVLAEAVGVIMVMTYLLKFSKTLHFYRLKLSLTSLYLTIRNAGYMMKLGFPTFLGEVAVSVIIIIGNYMFIKYLHEDGVAAFSVACYLFPLIFIFGNSIAQSQLPIISYNNGLGSTERVKSTIRISLVATFLLGLLISVGCALWCNPLITLFLDQRDSSPYNRDARLSLLCDGVSLHFDEPRGNRHLPRPRKGEFRHRLHVSARNRPGYPVLSSSSRDSRRKGSVARHSSRRSGHVCHYGHLLDCQDAKIPENTAIFQNLTALFRLFLCRLNDSNSLQSLPRRQIWN